MSQRKRILATAVASIAWAVFAPQIVSAANRTPIYYASAEYREAVRAFERQVLRTPKIRSSVERLVDDLEDSTSRLKSAAVDPARFDRLYARFIETDKLHSRVGLTFFGDPIFAPDPALEACWIEVDQAYVNLINEIQYLQQLRNLKRGKFVPIVNHAAGVVAPVAPGYVAPGYAVPPTYRTHPDSFYRSEYAPPFRTESYRSRRILSPNTPSSVLSPQSFEPAVSTPLQPSVLSSPAVPRGAQLQRSPGQVPPTRRTITTPEELRSAVIGALLQRQ